MMIDESMRRFVVLSATTVALLSASAGAANAQVPQTRIPCLPVTEWSTTCDNVDQHAYGGMPFIDRSVAPATTAIDNAHVCGPAMETPRSWRNVGRVAVAPQAERQHALLTTHGPLLVKTPTGVLSQPTAAGRAVRTYILGTGPGAGAVRLLMPEAFDIRTEGKRLVVQHRASRQQLAALQLRKAGTAIGGNPHEEEPVVVRATVDTAAGAPVHSVSVYDRLPGGDYVLDVEAVESGQGPVTTCLPTQQAAAANEQEVAGVCSGLVADLNRGYTLRVSGFETCGGDVVSGVVTLKLNLVKKFLFFKYLTLLARERAPRTGPGLIPISFKTRCKFGEHTYRATIEGKATFASPPYRGGGAARSNDVRFVC